MAYFPISLVSGANPTELDGNVETFLAVAGSSMDPLEFSFSIGGTLSSSYPYAFPSTAHTGEKYTSFKDDFYFRIRYLPPILNVGALTSAQTRDIYVWNGFFEAKTLDALTLQNGDGIVISGPATPTDYPPIELSQYTLTFSEEGPASIEAGILFDWEAGLDDFTVQIFGSRSILFPFLFQPGRTTEVLSWKTQVMTSEDGSEKRVRIRKTPRQGFNLAVTVDKDNQNLLDNILYAWRGNIFALPNSAECKTLTADTSLASSVVNVVTADADFRVGSAAVIYNDARDFVTFEVAVIGASTITATQNITKVMSAGALVIPILNTRLVSNPTREFSANRAQVRMSMEVIDNVVVPSSASPVLYLTDDTYFDEVDFPGDAGVSVYGRNVQTLDYQSSKVEIFPRWTNTKVGHRILVQMDSLSEINTFRTWLHRRGGKQRPFWMPTHENDFRLVTTGLLGSAIVVRDDGQLTLTGNRLNIAVKHVGGTIPAAIVPPIVQTGDNLTLTLDTALGIDAEDVISISYMDLKRLALDDIEIIWDGNFTAHSIFTVVNVE